MAESYASIVLLEIAKEMKRPPNSVAPFIQTLEDNWFDTKEALAAVSDQEFEKMKFPLKIVSLIREKLKTNSSFKQQSQSFMQEESIPQPILLQESLDSVYKKEFQNHIQIMKTDITDKTTFQKTLSTISKVLTNVVDNRLNPQFYSIKLTSKTLQQSIMAYQSALQFMNIAGWSVQGDLLILSQQVDMMKLKIAILALDQKLEEEQRVEAPKFDPYKSYFSTTTGTESKAGLSNADVAKQMGYDIYSFTDLLEILKQKRYVFISHIDKEVMSKPIQNRDLKVFQGTQNQSVSEIFQKLQNQGDLEEVQESNDPALREYLKKIAMVGTYFLSFQSLEDQKFASKRKKEYEDLIKKPIFGETVIRIKLPSNIILEAKFSPLETIQTLINFVHETLANPDLKYYIYTTPPVQKMTAKYHNQTLDDLECVPSGLFYFGFEKDVDEKQNLQVLKQEIYEQIPSQDKQ